MYLKKKLKKKDYSGPPGVSEASFGGIVIMCTSQLLVCVFGCVHIHLWGVKVETDVSPLETNSSGLGRTTLGVVEVAWPHLCRLTLDEALRPPQIEGEGVPLRCSRWVVNAEAQISKSTLNFSHLSGFASDSGTLCVVLALFWSF